MGWLWNLNIKIITILILTEIFPSVHETRCLKVLTIGNLYTYFICSFLFFYQWRWDWRARRCGYNSPGSRISLPWSCGAGFPPNTSTYATDAWSSLPSTYRRRGLLVRAQQQLRTQFRTNVEISKWTPSNINNCKFHDLGSCQNYVNVNHKLNTKVLSETIPIRSPAKVQSRLNSYQRMHHNDCRRQTQKNWKDYITLKKPLHENRKNYWCNKSNYFISLRK